MAQSRRAAASAPVVRTIRMRADKETAGAIRYTEIDEHDGKIMTDAEGAFFPTVYVRKSALRAWVGTDYPKIITVTVAQER